MTPTAIYVLTGPAGEPVSVDEAKIAARVDADNTALDGLIATYISGARQVAEQEIRRPLMRQTVRLCYSDWPGTTDRLPVYSATSIAVSYWDGTQWAQLGTGAFAYARQDLGTVIGPVVNTSWPVLGDVAVGERVRIDVTSGAATAAAVEPCAKTFITALVAHWLANPEAAQRGGLEEAPFLARLLDPLRTFQ